MSRGRGYANPGSGQIRLYDTYGRPVQLLENGTASLAKYSYDTLNRRTQVDLGNGTRTELGYDNQGWLQSLNHRFTSSTEDWLATITRNQLGDIKQAGVTNSRYAWTPAASTTAFTTNALNQYTGAAGKAVTYDRNGNLTGDGVWTYGYDLDNRMKTANRSGTSATLGYDPEGRMVRTTVNGAQTNLLYDGENLAAEYDATGKLTRRYVFGPGVDAPLVQYEGAATNAKSWLYANQQGSVVALANGTGATIASQAYGPFGETDGTPASRFGYTGQQYLAPLGLYYYKARMYSPTLGRFLQTDPVGTADDLNLYAYVRNDPINYSDPTGQFLVAPLIGGAVNAALGAGITYAKDLLTGTQTGLVDYRNNAMVDFGVGMAGVGIVSKIGTAASIVAKFGSTGAATIEGGAMFGTVAGGEIGKSAISSNPPTAGQTATAAIIGGLVSAAPSYTKAAGAVINSAVAKAAGKTASESAAAYSSVSTGIGGAMVGTFRK